MTNNFDSNITRKVARVFLEKFEASRVVTKTVNTQLLQGMFNPASGTIVDFKRPHDYVSHRTATGDISAVTKSSIVAGKASGIVQDYITVALEWDEVDEALKLDQLDQILMPAADRIITDLETDFSLFAMRNAGLAIGGATNPIGGDTLNTALGGAANVVDSWADVAYAGSMMDSIGVPNMGRRYFIMNPSSGTKLAGTQTQLDADQNLVRTAWMNAQISKPLGGLQAISSNALPILTSGTTTDRVGAVNSAAAATLVRYDAVKDTMYVDLPVDAFGASNTTITAGELVQIDAANAVRRISHSTRQAFLDVNGNQPLWTGTVVNDVTLTGGAGTLRLSGPPIFGLDASATSSTQYATVNAALADNNVVNLLGAANEQRAPGLFYHEQAFGIGFVPLKKLFSTDTLVTTKDGMRIRISKYADGDANKQMIRFDLLPAYAVFNPFFAGQAYGGQA